MKHTRQRTILWVVLLAALSTIALGKYEDQFGKVYDWKKEGLSRPLEAIASPTGTFLVQADSFTVIDPLGRTKISVDLEFSDYAIDRTNNRAYFLQKSKNSVQKFNILTGEFVETLSYNNGPISAVNIVEDRLVVVFKTSVYSGPLEQPLANVGRKFSDKINLVDSNLKIVLFEKQSNWCVQGLNKPKDKESDKESCIKKDNTNYIHASSTGFWFYNESDQTAVHLTPSGHQTSKLSVSSNQVLRSSHVSNYLLVKGNGTHKGLYLDGTSIQTTDLSTYTLCTYSSIPLVGHERAACVSKSTDSSRSLISAVPIGIKTSKAVNLATVAAEHTSLHAIWPSVGAADASPITVLTHSGDLSITNERGNFLWTRSTDFGEIVDVLVADYHSTEESDDIPRYESFGANFVGAFLFRVYTDINDLKNLALTAIPKLAANFNMKAIIEKIKGNQETVLEDISYYNRYGLRKNLIFVTSSQKLISVDSLSGVQGWKTTLKPGQRIVKSFINDQNQISLIYSEKDVKYMTEISSSDGSFLSSSKALDSKSSVFYVSEDSKSVAEINFRENTVSNLNQEYTYYKVDGKGVRGFLKNPAGKFEEIWNYNLEPGQTLLGYSYHLKGDTNYLGKLKQGSLVTLPEEEALYYKVVDSGNIGLVIKHSVNGVESVIITLLNTVRGRVLGTYQQPDIDFKQPVVYLYDDNGFFLSYYNPKMLNFELWSIEIYRKKIETSFMDMLQNYVLKTKKPEDLDYSREPNQFIILDRKYGLNTGLKSLTAVTTPSSLTKRNLIGVTLNNNIVSFDRILVSARRNDEAALKKDKGRGKLSYHSMVFPPYSYSLPTAHTNILNANWKLSGISKVLIVPTKFESTSLVVCLGRDLFVTKIQPDNTFDLLNDDFNYILLGLVSVVITVLVVVLRRLAKKAETKKRFYTS